jgi:hypothetical protein
MCLFSNCFGCGPPLIPSTAGTNYCLMVVTLNLWICMNLLFSNYTAVFGSHFLSPVWREELMSSPGVQVNPVDFFSSEIIVCRKSWRIFFQFRPRGGREIGQINGGNAATDEWFFWDCRQKRRFSVGFHVTSRRAPVIDWNGGSKPCYSFIPPRSLSFVSCSPNTKCALIFWLL